MNPLQMSRFKSAQYLLIARAGLAVPQMSAMPSESLETHILIEMTEDAFKDQNNVLNGLDKNVMLRTKGCNSLTAKPGDLHSGCSLWRKYGDIKRVILNELSNDFESLKVNGQPRSGQTIEDLLEEVRAITGILVTI